MNDDRAFERATREWLADGSDRTPPAAIDAVLLAVRTTSQERDLRIPWRTAPMSNPMRFVAAIAAVAVVVIGGLTIASRSNPATGGASPSPTATSGASPTAPATSVAPVACAPSTVAPGPSPTSRVAGAVQIAAGAVLNGGTTYTPSLFTPAFTFVGQACWLVRGDDAPMVAIWANREDISAGLFVIMRPGAVLDPAGTPAAVPADLVAWLRARSDLSVGLPTSIRVGGYSATLLEGTVLPNAKTNEGNALNIACAEDPSGCATGNPDGLGFLAGAHFQLVVLSVRGQTLLIDMTAAAANWDAVKPGFQALLAGLAFPTAG